MIGVPLDLAELRDSLAGVPGLRPLAMSEVIIGPGALDRLGELASEHADIVVLAAATPITARDGDLAEAVRARTGAACRLTWVVLGPPDGNVHADEPTVAAARAAAAGAGCVITAGSGTISDIGKAAAPPGTPLVAVQTATSVNGYADPFSVLLRAGVKRTTPARWPDVLIADTGVLAGAPARLSLAGVGDMAAMFTATADWYLAALLGAGGPEFRAEVTGLVRPYGEEMLGHGAGLAADEARLAGLARLLALSGIGMGVTGSTAPASGMEHAVSHLLEMAATATGAAASLHGEQVGAASVIAAAAWAHVRQRIAAGALGRPARLPGPDTARARIEAAFAVLDPSGAMAAECFEDYAAKARLLAASPDPLAGLRDALDDAGEVIGAMLAGPADLAAGLRAAGLPARLADLPEPVGRDQARWAVAHCALQRRRLGVADLAMLLGAWEPDDVDAVLDAADRAGSP